MDAPRDFFFFFSPNEQRARGGGGGGAARLFFFFFPCSADHEREWPPCKVVFFGLATNALNVRNNNFSLNNEVRGKKMSERLGGIIGCKYKTSSWHLNGFPFGSNIGSTV